MDMEKLRGPILIVESDPVDALNMERTIADLGSPYQVQRVSNCEEALFSLQSDASLLPALILLALDTPPMQGLEFLKTLKCENHLQHIPVVILSRQKLEHHVTASYALGAVGYIVKSDNYEEMSEAIAIIVRYWGLSLLPSSCPGEHCENTYLTG